MTTMELVAVILVVLIGVGIGLVIRVSRTPRVGHSATTHPSSALSHLRCTKCRQQLESMGSSYGENVQRGAIVSSMSGLPLNETLRRNEMWYGTVCVTCRSVYCYNCFKGGECPKCRTTLKVAYRQTLESIGLHPD
jgi:hypothetical protein